MEVINDYSYGIIPVNKNNGGQFSFCLVKHRGGHWAFPKGHPYENETIEETAKRELREETGITECQIIPQRQFIEEYTFQKDGETYKKTVTYFIGLTQSMIAQTEEEFKTEIKKVVWLNFEETLKKLTFPEAKAILVEAHVFVENHT